MFALSNLALRFLLELAGLAALGYAGFVLLEGPARWVAAVVAPSVLMVVWMIVVAPKASNQLEPWTRILIGSALLIAAGASLGLAGQPVPATALVTLVVVNTVLMAVLGQAGTTATAVAR